MNDPELVVLDEPMSGLDPIGRKEVRDLILELRDQGKTVFFSSHILTDIEAIADRVAIIARGQLTRRARRPSSIQRRARRRRHGAARGRATVDDLTSRRDARAAHRRRAVADVACRRRRRRVAREGARAGGAKVVSVAPRHETLEDLFLRQIASADQASAATEGRV